MRGLQAWLAGRPLVASALAYCIGIATGHLLGAGPPATGFAAGAVLVSLVVRIGVIRLGALLAAFALAGVGSASARRHTVLAGLDEGEQLLEGVAAERARSSGGRTKLLMRADTRLRDGVHEPVQLGVRLSCRGEAAVLAGDRIRVRAKLFRPAPPANPGAYAWYARLAAEGTAFTGACRAEELVILGPPDPLAARAEAFRRRFRALVEAAIPNRDASALVIALAIGDRAELSEEVNEEFGASGLAHILSVSGLHVTIIAAGLFLALRALLACSERLLLTGLVPPLASLLAVPACWLYVGLTGSDVPAVRSGIMASVLLLARVVRRDAASASSIAAALLAVLAWDPGALRDVSFQLSFVALAALVLLTDPLLRLAGLGPGDRSGRLQRLGTLLATSAAASLAATLATVPIVAGLFHQVSLVSVLTNVIALPLSTAVTALSAGATLLAALHDAPAALALIFAGLSAEWLIALSRSSASLPFATAVLPSFSAFASLLWFIGLAAIRLHQPWRTWPARLGAACAAGLAILAAAHVFGPAFSRELQVTFFSVGQGDAVLVRFPGGRTLLVDAGGDPSGGFDPGRRILLPAFAELGVSRLDAFVLSHPHPDHLLGALSLFGRIPIGEVWWAEGTEERGLLMQLRALAAEHGASVHTIASPRSIEAFAPVALQALHPRTIDAATSVNDGSLVLHLALGEVSFLLTGDIEHESEASLLEGIPHATVLKAPHHGSRTSSTAPFVRRVGPKHVVFCVGRGNRFGFPHTEVEERYRAAGCTLHRTDRHGAITFRTDGAKLEVERTLE